ncbi:MAG: peptide ABC transporter substrate-binding protein, partial [Parvibaculaceae bacterium]
MKKAISDPLVSVLLKDAKAHRISRRTFMEGALVAGLAVPAAQFIWKTEVRAAEPKRGGTFRAGLHDGSTTDTLDPATAISIFGVQINNATKSFLTEISPTNEISSDAAESWQASPDAKQW